jgi:hypothetical protein
MITATSDYPLPSLSPYLFKCCYNYEKTNKVKPTLLPLPLPPIGLSYMQVKIDNIYIYNKTESWRGKKEGR